MVKIVIGCKKPQEAERLLLAALEMVREGSDEIIIEGEGLTLESSNVRPNVLSVNQDFRGTDLSGGNVSIVGVRIDGLG